MDDSVGGYGGDAPIVRVSVQRPDAVALLPGVVAGAASLLGADGISGSRIGLLAEQVAEAIFADPFNSGIDLTIDVEVAHCPGGLVVRLLDEGAPSAFGRGELPSHIASLIGLGFAHDLDARTLGAEGNVTELYVGLHYPRASVDDAPPEPGPRPESDPVEYRQMQPEDVLGVCRLFFRTYGYTYSLVPYIFEPEPFSEFVASGRHVATVAVDASGRVIGHIASVGSKADAAACVVGMLAVDPDYRGRGLGGALAWAHAHLIMERGFVGFYSDAVASHDRSQRLALAAGHTECGVLLGAVPSDVEFRDLAEESDQRSSLVIFFGSIAPVPHRISYVPPPYAEVVSRIYAEASLDREIASGTEPGPDALPKGTRFSVHLHQEARSAKLTLESYGRDFDSKLQEQMTGFRRAGYEYVSLFLPLGDPLTCHFGAGLRPLGLSFAGIYPELQAGDWLAMQAPLGVDTDVEESSIVVASEFGRTLLDIVLDDFRHARASRAAHERSRIELARRAETWEATAQEGDD